MAARKKVTSKKRKAIKKSPVAKRKVASKAKRGAKKTSKKSTSRSSAVKASGPISVGKKPFSKSQFISEAAAHAGIPRKDAVAFMEAQVNIICAHLQKGGPQIFSWPGMFKIKLVKKPATKARQGINPFTGEMTTFKAKPASLRVKILPLKGLKEAVS